MRLCTVVVVPAAAVAAVVAAVAAVAAAAAAAVVVVAAAAAAAAAVNAFSFLAQYVTLIFLLSCHTYNSFPGLFAPQLTASFVRFFRS